MACSGLGAWKRLGERIVYSVFLFEEQLKIWPWDGQVESPWTHYAPATVGKKLELESDIWETVSQTSQ